MVHEVVTGVAERGDEVRLYTASSVAFPNGAVTWDVDSDLESDGIPDGWTLLAGDQEWSVPLGLYAVTVTCDMGGALADTTKYAAISPHVRGFNSVASNLVTGHPTNAPSLTFSETGWTADSGDGTTHIDLRAYSDAGVTGYFGLRICRIA